MKKEAPASRATKPSAVSVRLLCFYSGSDGVHAAGSTVTVTPEEAERLVAIGAAVADK